ncbi:hypothetical protein POM88_027787 [Heracleum sosnowskyi]|uniref:Transposase n=1 Tax=Heracleum sosnowskyi TaxID=360622 RepID=A0AAD8IAV6_9APIA|nr:hypothetical protein POM88_027787 [Heracleum sosnowskyi]
MNDLQVNSPRRSSRLNNQEVNSRRRSPCGDAAQKVVDATVNLNAACVKRKLDLCNPPNAYEEMGDIEAMAEDEEDDEEIRYDAVYKFLGLPTLAKDFNGEMKKSKKKVQIREECSEYVPGAEEHVGDDVAEKPRKRTKKAFKTKLPGGPTTRSRSNPVTAPQKEATVKDVGKSILVEPAEQIQLPQSGLGTMADYLILRDRQKKENAEKKAAVASGSGTARQPVDGENVLPDIGDDEAEEVVVPKRTRGKTNMDKVHTRPFDKRIVVNMNEKFQPIVDDDKVITELGYFLGTLKRCVPLTYKSWTDVPQNLKNTLLNYVKQRYVFPEEWEKWYWGDEEVQAKAKKNAESQKLYVDTHTAGPKLFSQIRHKMTKESDGALFVKTRKRKEDREYKTDGKVTKFMIENIQKILGTDLSGPSEGVDELLLQGKSHGPTWLIGRCAKPDKRSTSGPTDSQITDLTTKIRQQVVNEMEEKLKQKVQEEVDEKVNKKVRENLTWVLTKLGKANPSININLGELCTTISNDNDNGTPITDAIS